jgi:hypothetical protein
MADRLVSIPNQPGWRDNSPKKLPGAKHWGRRANFGTFLQPDGSEVAIELRAEDRNMSLKRPTREYEGRFDTTARLFNSTGLSEPAGRTFTPKFARHEKKVLRWFGFYREAVSESQVEQERLRKVSILYYLEDDTMELTEPRETNSGLPQGNFVRRHAIEMQTDEGKMQAIAESKSGGGVRTIHWSDIHVGAFLNIYSKKIMVTDADGFTRGYVEENGGVAQGATIPLPSGIKTTWKEFVPMWLQDKVQDKDFKRYCEALLGKSWHDSEKMDRFINYNGLSLKFAAYWDDTGKAKEGAIDHGQIVDLTFVYYLEDDTMQIIEVEKPNSGKGPFTKLWARARLLKDWEKDYFGTRSDVDRREYYTFKDFQIGSTVSVFGRPVKICAIDAPTRIWFENNVTHAGFEQPQDNYRRDPPVVWPVREPPKWSGLGGEEDTLNSCKRLVPRRPRRDEKKYHKFEGQILKFNSRMKSAVNENNERHFVIVYYLEDDTFRVFEPPIPNAGFAGGKFLLRGKYRPNGKTSGEPYISAKDLVIGRTLRVNHFEFEITAMDGATRAYLTERGEINNHVAEELRASF